ncbi:MAG TPA: S-methyl-5-thioribose-1-phosphate isomerase [Candidatus Eisenbacteria bacterium]
MTLDPFRLEGNRVLLLDQTRLPEEERWIDVRDAVGMAEAIAALRVRGAPAIGIAAALVLAVESGHGEGSAAERLGRVDLAGSLLRAARPTAVNLSWAIGRMIAAGAREAAASSDGDAWARALRAEALAIWEEDRAASRAMAAHGAALFPEGRRFLTHCHTGGLATGGGGTALAVLLELNRRREGGIEVWATETRPLLQGARLTAWELGRAGVRTRLIADGAAASLMVRERIEGVLVGADRVARNGDVANKIGTYALALAAREAGIPFVVVAPTSTLDPSLPDGAAIPIEERDPSELRAVRGVPTAPPGVRAQNPAFDVTPARLVTYLVTERGVQRPGSGAAPVLGVAPGGG